MAFVRRWKGTGVFLGTELRMTLHDPLAIASSALVEGILLVFVWVLARDLLPFALLGSLVYSLFLIGQYVLSEAAYIRIDHRLNEMYHASPLSPEAYFLGMASGIGIGYIPTTLALFVLALVVVPMTAAGFVAILGVLLAVWTISASIAYTISTLFKDMKAIWPWASLIANVLGVVPPVFYPLDRWPVEWRSLALVLPTSGGAALAEAAAGILPLAQDEVVLAATALGLEALVAFAFTVWWSHRSAREA